MSQTGRRAGLVVGGLATVSAIFLAVATTATAREPQVSDRTAITAATPQRSENLDKVGFLDLGGFNADIWYHRGYAYVGTWGNGTGCPAKGVRIVDVRNETQPELAGALAAGANPTEVSYSGTSQEDVMVSRINTPSFSGDLLAVGIQPCNKGVISPKRGVDLWDVSDPENPVHLAFWRSNFTSNGWGVHELYLFQQGERAFVAAAVPFSDSERDFRLVEVTDPTQPVEVSRWRLQDAGLEPTGGNIFVHSVHANRAGTKVFVSYWDFGEVILDISDPTSPQYLGRTVYPQAASGDTHSAWLSRGENYLYVADEDLSPQDGTWGFLRIWDIRNPANPKQLKVWKTANSSAPAPESSGDFTIHNPFIVGRRAFLSWYSDGVRVLDIANPRRPQEVAYFVPRSQPDPFGVLPNAPEVWGVVARGDLVFASDMNQGLFILRLGAGADRLDFSDLALRQPAPALSFQPQSRSAGSANLLCVAALADAE